MSQPGKRLGDLIDDYCPRCRLLLNHAVASMIGENVAKVICQTCFTEHPYRRGEGGKKKLANPRATLFDQVVSAMPSPAVAPDPPDVIPAKKRTATPARYITRHKGKPPRKAH
ncbi:MAG: hypothetical protein ACRD3D_04770 [Terriglobia bacterium]